MSNVIKVLATRKEREKTGVTHHYFKILKIIGEGGQGETQLVENEKTRKLLVRKTQKDFLMRGDIPMEMYIFEEVLALHPSIVGFHNANYKKEDRSLVLYFDHCSGGDLEKHIPKKGYIPEDFMWHVFIQLADALAYLHYGVSRKYRNPNSSWRRVIHRDVKPGNVFLKRPITGKNPIPEVVLGDFGIATLDEHTKGCGTPDWMAPEVPVVTKQGDVWGLGAIIHALAHGRGPVGNPPVDWPKRNLHKWWWAPEARKPKEMPTRYSSKLNANMMDCLTRNPNKRISSLELLHSLEKEAPRHIR